MGCFILRKAGTVSVLLLAGLVAGCARKGVEFTDIQCHPVREGERVRSVVFSASVQTYGLESRQLIFQVNLFDHRRRPVMSTDDRYRTRDGTVGASRTFMVLRRGQSFRELRTEIPAEQLEIREHHLPVIVRYGIHEVDGRMITATSRRLPITSIRELRPPVDEEPEATEAYWFIRSPEGEFPILLGPFANPDEAMKNVTNPIDLPRRYRETDAVWFLPVREDDADDEVSWLGPFASLNDAEEAACLLEERLRDLHETTGKEDRPVIMLPTQIPLMQGMAQPAHLADLP